jgi:hypothetical protein
MVLANLTPLTPIAIAQKTGIAKPDGIIAVRY